MGHEKNTRSLSTNVAIHNATLIVIYFLVLFVVIDEVLHTFYSFIFILGTLFDPLTVNICLAWPACSFGHSSVIVLF